MLRQLYPLGSFKVHLKTKKMTNISQAQAGFKANSRRNPLWISRLFNAKSSCACRNRLNFRLFRYTLDKNTVVSLLYRFPAKMQLPCRNGRSIVAVFMGVEAHLAQRGQQRPQRDRGERTHDKPKHQHDRRVVQRQGRGDDDPCAQQLPHVMRQCAADRQNEPMWAAPAEDSTAPTSPQGTKARRTVRESPP